MSLDSTLSESLGGSNLISGSTPATTSAQSRKEQISAYRDRRFRGTQEEFEQALRVSTTVYVGNLSFYTTEEQIYEVFSKAGEIRRIVMGLDKNTMTPCGFCFVAYYVREDAEDAVKYVSSTILDDRPIRVDFDWGYEDGRQWGRGRSGGQSGWQVRDEYRTDYDPDMCLSRLSFASLACIPLTLMGGGGVEGKSGTNTAPIMTQICASLASIRHISPSPLPRLYGGRGQSGWQVRDEYRTDYDPDMCLSRLSFASLACIPLTLMGGGGVEGKSGTNTAPTMTQICASLAQLLALCAC
ncbi:unnamed protein product [Closterium sp. Naga37s-1]|nr:unnamed protein product [Closterium sp. Naga37s-1]